MNRFSTLSKGSPNILCFLLLTLLTASGTAQTPARIINPVSDTDTVTVTGTKPAFVQTQYDSGRVDPSQPMQRILLLLKPSDDQKAALKKVLNDQQDPASPGHGHWLAPQDYATQFGPADADLQKISDWLQQHGFQVDNVANGRQWIEFSGTSAQVETTFHTEMHHYAVNGKDYIANSTDISLPRALTPVVEGVVSLTNFEKVPMQTPATLVGRGTGASLAPVGTFTLGNNGSASVDPSFTLVAPSGTYHFISPGDFQKIYNVSPLLNSGTDGSGVSIAIVGRTDIRLSDIESFRQIFGLPSNDPTIITNGADPGYTGDEIEADLDLEWSGSSAPKAHIIYVASASTATTDGVDLSAAYIIDNRLAPIMSTSYGLCEAFLGSTGNAFYEALWKQAAAEGITPLVSSGDNGAAGCDPTVSFFPAKYGRNVSGLASTPYNVAVGGTEFNENGQDSTFWSLQNNSDQSSVLGYIPEVAWNESCNPTTDPQKCGGTNKYHLIGGSGGPSSCSNVTWTMVGNQTNITCNGGYPKPSWQAGPNVPNDGVRDLPDVSLNAAGGHDGYLMCVEGTCQTSVANGNTVLENALVVGGTSVSSPAMAGIMALVEQKHGQYLGLPNYTFYQLAAAQQASQCNSSNFTDPTQISSCVFSDTTAGNNGVPGVNGFDAVAGYDMATGLGSVNVANLVAQWPNGKKLPTETILTSAVRRAQHGQPVALNAKVQVQQGVGTPSGDLALEAGDGTYTSPVPLTNGSFSGTVNDLPGGQYLLKAHYNGDAMFDGSDSNPVPLVITPEDSTVTVQPWNLNLINFWVPTAGSVFYGTGVALNVTVNGISGVGQATGTVTVYDGTTLVGTVPILGGSAWVPLDPLLTSSLEVGTHNFTVKYSGDSSFNPSQTAQPVAVTIGKAFINYARITGDVTSLAAGTTEQLHMVVLAPGTATPSGTVQLFDNGTAVTGQIALDATAPKGAFQATYSDTFTAGSHQLRISYSGDSHYFAVAPPSFRTPQFLVTATASSGAATNVTISQNSSTVVVGQSGTYIVTVTPTSSGGVIPTGTVSLKGQSGYTAAGPITLVNGTATLSVPWSKYLGAGENELLAQYSGDSNYAPSISAEIITTVNPATPTVSLAANASQVWPGTTSDLTVDVQPTLTDPKIALPYGTVQFYDSVNGSAPMPLGSAQSLAQGNGNFTTYVLATTLPTGTNVITVRYLGSFNGEWGPANSSPTMVTVKPGAVPASGQ